MIIDESQEYFEEMKLYNDVMGIALAVWGNAGDCPVFRIMDKALDDFSLEQMGCIKEAFEMMPEKMQQDVMAETKTVTSEAAIARLGENVTMLISSREARSA